MSIYMGGILHTTLYQKYVILNDTGNCSKVYYFFYDSLKNCIV